MSNGKSIHHVELSKSPIQIKDDDKQIIFDECNKQLVTVTPRGICCIPLEGDKKGIRYQFRYAYILSL